MMDRSAAAAARELDDAIDYGVPAPLVDAATINAARLLQADADAESGAMPGALEVRMRVLEAVVDLQMQEGTRRRRGSRVGRGARFGHRALTHGLCALAAMGGTAALAQTSTPPGDAVRSVARTAAHALNLPAPAASAGERSEQPTPPPTRDDARDRGAGDVRPGEPGAPVAPGGTEGEPGMIAPGGEGVMQPDEMRPPPMGDRPPPGAESPQRPDATRPPIEGSPPAYQQPPPDGQTQPLQPPPDGAPRPPADGGTAPAPAPRPPAQQPGTPLPPIGAPRPPAGTQPAPAAPRPPAVQPIAGAPAPALAPKPPLT